MGVTTKCCVIIVLLLVVVAVAVTIGVLYGVGVIGEIKNSGKSERIKKFYDKVSKKLIKFKFALKVVINSIRSFSYNEVNY